MKRINFILAICFAALLASCSKDNTFVINGSFDIPTSFQYGDTIIERGPIEGSVYLYDVNEVLIDSVAIADEQFILTGICEPTEPYFAFLVSEFGAGMVVIEPGTIDVVINETLTATGTETNDAISDVNALLENISAEMYAEMMPLLSSGSEADQPEDSEALIMPIVNRYMEMANQKVDSVYQQNTDNLLGVYLANMQTSDQETADGLMEALEGYSEYVRNSELIQMRLQYLQQMEALSSFYGSEDDESDEAGAE